MLIQSWKIFKRGTSLTPAPPSDDDDDDDAFLITEVPLARHLKNPEQEWFEHREIIWCTRATGGSAARASLCCLGITELS